MGLQEEVFVLGIIKIRSPALSYFIKFHQYNTQLQLFSFAFLCFYFENTKMEFLILECIIHISY